MHLGSIELTRFRIDVIDGGACWMDGGAIFGVVPKPLWSKSVPPTPTTASECRFSRCSPEATMRPS